MFRSYPYQHIAVLGMVVIIRGLNPRQNPAYPSLLLIIAAASTKPFAFRISGSVIDPRVCSSVLITSNGVVIAAAKPPASPPATQCVIGSYFFEGFIIRDRDSYAINCIAVNGTVIVKVVG